MRGMLKKLRSNSGESLVEVLISLLISSLALIMLAAMIRGATNAVLTSEKTMHAYYDKSVVLNRQADTDKEDDTLTVSIKSGETVIPVTNVNYFIDGEIKGIDVISYKKAG